MSPPIGASRRQRIAASVMLRGYELGDRLLSPLLTDVPAPAEDPFYDSPGAAPGDPPDDLASRRPGELLDSRPVEVRAFRRPVQADAWQVKFRSTDTRGAPASGVATVMVPRRSFREPVRPLLSYQCAIDSLGAAADPSYTLRRGNQKELGLMRRALRRGWAVVTTDYTGPRHAYGAGLLAGRFVLDGIRAAVAFEPAGFDAKTPIGLWGYSGGAQATAWAAEQHPGYAPELNIVAAAAGGVPVDLISSIPLFDGSIFSGLGVGGCIGISREFPDVDVLGTVTPEARDMLAAAAEMTVDQLMVNFPFRRWRDYLTVGDVLSIPGMRAAFESNALGQATPRATMYLYHAVHDQLLAIADVGELVVKYRQEGADVTYTRFRFGEHVIVALTGVPSAYRFLAEQFGSPIRRSRKRTRDPAMSPANGLGVRRSRLAGRRRAEYEPLH